MPRTLGLYVDVEVQAVETEKILQLRGHSIAQALDGDHCVWRVAALKLPKPFEEEE